MFFLLVSKENALTAQGQDVGMESTIAGVGGPGFWEI